MWQAMLPAINALRAITAKSLVRFGAMTLSAAICMPILGRLPNPHSRYVDISSERSLVHMDTNFPLRNNESLALKQVKRLVE